MKRAIIAEIERWNAMEAVRKPLILMGARQVGKSWLMKTFAETHYPEDTVFVDLHDDVALCEAIEDSRSDALGILEIISTATGKKIVPGKTLLVLDEIQECPRLLTSLKYFHEKKPQLAVMAAGSLLGLSLNRDDKRKRCRQRKFRFLSGRLTFLRFRR